ncbi:hypothetical protein HMI54_007772 [Coelomomyces lativittatus]|nr:hypothetical protein HMI56_003566 [Coelomomyces lativittatus]KAJ1516287.1 hypothetical protein HMI55_002607 [Coelomomyces lativittatus]KAJ1516912.1 hypothetical protein HMI54_007772 [Coelomomyces lativittatus]
MVNTAGPPTTDNPIKAVPENVILPPPEIRNVVDKTANFVARNGIQFEEKIRENEKNNSKFYFLNPKDPYHAYYQWKLVEYKEGGAQLPLSASTAASLQQDSKVEDSMGHTGPPSQSLPTIVVTPPAPRPLEFMIDIPPMSSQD